MKNEKKQSFIPLGNRLQYWFDNRMSKGSLGLIRLLIIVSVILAVLVALLIIAFGFNGDKEKNSVVWDSIATLINAWMPAFEDGTPGYVVLMSVVAIIGVLFTSVLIGIVTSTIEEKVNILKRGNSMVLEKGHIVVLGFNQGEYSLLNQLILAAAGKRTCVVIAEDMEREEMEQSIGENLIVPKNFRFVCRKADITDPASLEKCSVETCKTIIVQPSNDLKTIKAVLAVSALLKKKKRPEITVNAIIHKNEYRFPPSLAEANNITTLSTNDVLAKMIAHSCTQNGLSETFREIFNFEGSEFYLSSIAGIDGLSFEELMVRLDRAVPAGVFRNDKVIINPPASFRLTKNDKVLYFAEERDCAELLDDSSEANKDIEIAYHITEESTDATILGHNETLPIIITELPENVSCIYLEKTKLGQNEKTALERIAKERDISIHYIREDPHRENVLQKLAQSAKHIIVLNDHSLDPEKADLDVIFLLLNLRDLRTRYGLSFNITVEMQKEHNQKLVGEGDHTDFLVASSMSSLILAQISESPELMDVFHEILSNKGNEVYLKNVGELRLTGEHSVRDIRRIMLKRGYILLGYLNAEKESHFNLPLNQRLNLFEEDHLIVLGEK